MPKQASHDLNEFIAALQDSSFFARAGQGFALLTPGDWQGLRRWAEPRGNMTGHHRLQLMGRYLAATPRLRLEFSLRLAGAELRLRPAPLFWLGAAHRDSQADFARLHQLLRAFECPQELLEYQLARSPGSLYQGVAIDLDAARVRGNLFMHCRDKTRERRLGLGWDGQTLHFTEYRVGPLTDVGDRYWLLNHVHRDYRGLLEALLREARLSGQGGYWVQREQVQDTEIYLTYPWHPPLASLAPSLNAHLLTPLPESWQRYRAAPIRHIGFSCRADPMPAMTLYASAPYAGSWPLSLGELEEKVMGTPVLSPRSPGSGRAPR